jgi:putative ABC transport system ATP-binding protein
MDTPLARPPVCRRYAQEATISEHKSPVREPLERMKIRHRARHMPQHLSGARHQRAAIARAVLLRSKLIPADEPTKTLDTASGEEVMQHFTELSAEGTTVLMVTHCPSPAEYTH